MLEIRGAHTPEKLYLQLTILTMTARYLSITKVTGTGRSAENNREKQNKITKTHDNHNQSIRYDK